MVKALQRCLLLHGESVKKTQEQSLDTYLKHTFKISIQANLAPEPTPEQTADTQNEITNKEK